MFSHFVQQSKMGKSMSLESSISAGANGEGKKGNFIAGRTEMFEKKMAELTTAREQLRPPKQPKNFKWQVNPFVGIVRPILISIYSKCFRLAFNPNNWVHPSTKSQHHRQNSLNVF
jgi:hypothetical protein